MMEKLQRDSARRFDLGRDKLLELGGYTYLIDGTSLEDTIFKQKWIDMTTQVRQHILIKLKGDKIPDGVWLKIGTQFCATLNDKQIDEMANEAGCGSEIGPNYACFTD